MNIIDLATKTLQLAIQTAVAGVKTVVDAIKTVVDATKTKVDAVDNNVGSPTTTANNATNSNAHAKLNWLTTNVSTLLNGRVVKSVQKGVFSFPDNTTSFSIPLSTINNSKSFVILDGLNKTDPDSTPYLSSLTPNHLTLQTSGSSTGASNKSISWQVIEFY